jgi:hypothetical protein
MGRKMKKDQEDVYTHLIGLKVTDAMYKWLDGMVKTSDCQSVPELVRRIIGKKRVLIFQYDSSLDRHWDELVELTGEIHAIGVNINQITHHFNSVANENQKIFHALKVAEQYNKVGELIKQVIFILGELERKWLQE